MKLIYFVLLLAFPCFLQAQRNFDRNTGRFEVGLLGGATHYSGDITQPHIELMQTRTAFGVFGRYHLNYAFSARVQAIAARYWGDDKTSKDRKPRQFRTSGPINEFSAVLEYQPWHIGEEAKFGMTRFWYPYVFAGVGYALTSSKVEHYGPDADKAIYIKTPLPEGGVTKRNFVTTPIGGGLRATFNAKFSVGFELGWRPVYSDLLDGVSLNGNPEENDWYHFWMFSTSYFFGEP